MSNLDPEARRLLDAALPGLSPSDAAKARIRAHLTALGPPDAGDAHDDQCEHYVDDAPLPPRDSLPASKFKPLGLVLGGLVVGGVGGFVLGYQLATSQPRSTVVEVSSSASVSTSEAAPNTSALSNGASASASTPPRDEPAAATLDAAAKRPPTRDVRDAAARVHGGLTTTVATPASDEDEVTWVLRVRKALARGEPQLALGLLRELDVKVPKGRLGEERAAGRAIARCLLQPTTGAAESESFVSRYPSSIHLGRVTRSCSKAATHDVRTTRDVQTREPTKP